ncbi:MAG: hypothetical protein CMJ18_15350 [Phycisphaeraceae bacterium]|nr:hypothetical protein [Phycisphaeraceae bacterium]
MTGESVTRQIMDNVPGWMQVTFYAAALAGCGIAVLAFIARISRHRRGRESPARPRSALGSATAVVAYLTFHRELRRDPYAGAAHLMTFYGFLILFIGTCLVFLEHSTPLHFFYGWCYVISSLVIDLGGVAFLAGLAMFAWRRASNGSHRILSAWWVGSLTVLLGLIGLTGFTLEAARIAIDMPEHERWSVVGYALATALRTVGIGDDVAARLHRVLWAAHAVLCVAFFVLLPWRFFGHMVYGAASWATRSGKPISALRAPSGPPGSTAWRDLTVRDLLHADACTTCGRCNEMCPAETAGKPLHPREIILGLRVGTAREDRDLSSLIPDEAIWACTTCGACNEACPVGIDVYDKIVDLRRGRVETGVVPPAAQAVFESQAREDNPFGKPGAERMNWAAGLSVAEAKPDEPIELLYWVGCAGSFDPDGRSVTRAMIRILDHLDVHYRLLGRRECCTGDPARRMGEEGLFQQQARAVIDLLRAHSVERVLTHCPHCFNVFRNEYPQLGCTVQVEHHSQFLLRQVAEGRLTLDGGDAGAVTLHDPCYLGRGNGVTDSPRDVLRSLAGIDHREMPRHGRASFCCGAGGGSSWLDTPGAVRVENLRAAEAQGTGASTIATACPFCKSTLTAGCQSIERGAPIVKDLAELVVAAEGLSST